MARRHYDNSEVQIGDILHAGWGATMILHSFYQVVALNGKTQCTVVPVESVNTGYKGPFRNGIKVMQPIMQSGEAMRVSVIPSDDNYGYSVKIKDYQRAFYMEDIDKEYIEDTCGN